MERARVSAEQEVEAEMMEAEVMMTEVVMMKRARGRRRNPSKQITQATF